MMHGTQRLTLTYASVQEALHDYLQKHMGDDVKIVMQDWTVTPNNYNGPKEETLIIEFSQAAVEGPKEDSYEASVALPEPTAL